MKAGTTGGSMAFGTDTAISPPGPFQARWRVFLCALIFLASGCNNDPYPPEPAGKKILHLWLADDPKTLDPSSSLVPDIVDCLYPAYFEYDYLMRDPIRLNLELGATYPTARPHPLPNGKIGERWTFRLKKGLR